MASTSTRRKARICILSEGGELLERRIRTEARRFAELLEERPRARIRLEASTESEWVARCLEGLGHEIIVADPNFAPMDAARSRKIKTDRRDAWALGPIKWRPIWGWCRASGVPGRANAATQARLPGHEVS